MTEHPRQKQRVGKRPRSTASRAQACSPHCACTGPPTLSAGLDLGLVAGWSGSGRGLVTSASRRLQGKKPVAGRVRKKGWKPNTEVVAAPGKQVEAVTATSETKTQRQRVGACREVSAF